MFFAAYHFDGSPAELLPAHDRLLASLPPDDVVLHLCVAREGGITVYDTCPSEAVFTAFRADPGFHAAVAAAGLPEPRIEALGEVHAVCGRQTVPS